MKNTESSLQVRRPGFNSRQEQWCFFFCLRRRVQICSGAKPVTYPMDTGDLSSGVKGPGREADLLPPLVPKLRMIGDYTSTPPYDFTAW